MTNIIVNKSLTTHLSIVILMSVCTLSCNGQKEDAAVEPPPAASLGMENLLPDLLPKPVRNEARSPLYLSHDFGATWEDVGHNLPQEVQVSFLEAYGDEFLLATDNAGLFLSENQRASWRQLGGSLPGKKINALHITDEQLLVSVYGHGVFRTNDLGQHWENIDYNLPKRNVQSILMADDLLAGTDVGIYRLNATSQQWQLISEPVQVLSLERRADRLIAGTHQGTLLSVDGGKSWSWSHREGAVHYTHLAGDRIVEMYVHGDVFLSDDWGENWRDIEYAPRRNSYVYEIVAIGDYLVMSNNYGIHRSADDGKTWRLVYATESMGFFDFLVKGELLYGGTRTWDEYRGR